MWVVGAENPDLLRKPKWPNTSILPICEMVADKVPARDALVCGERRATYAALEQRANQLAHYRRVRSGAGDHVGLYLYNCNEYLEAMLACFKLRAVPINVNYRYVEEELLYIFTNADLVACIHHQEFALISPRSNPVRRLSRRLCMSPMTAVATPHR